MKAGFAPLQPKRAGEGGEGDGLNIGLRRQIGVF